MMYNWFLIGHKYSMRDAFLTNDMCFDYLHIDKS